MYYYYEAHGPILSIHERCIFKKKIHGESLDFYVKQNGNTYNIEISGGKYNRHFSNI